MLVLGVEKETAFNRIVLDFSVVAATHAATSSLANPSPPRTSLRATNSGN